MLRHLFTTRWVSIGLAVAALASGVSAQERPTRLASLSLPARTVPPPAPVMWMPALAPFAHVRFCIEYPDQCQRRKVSLRKGGVLATQARFNELLDVHQRVNRAIHPSTDFEGATGDTWTIAPKAGDCDDYAVTKRKLLLDAGWPSNTLLLAHTIAAGQDHLVLIVRLKQGEVVLDNLARDIRPVRLDRMAIVKVQSPMAPALWIRPLTPDAMAKATANRRA